MKSEALDKKHDEVDKDSIYKEYEIKLTKEEAENLVERLEKGPNDKAKAFLKESIEFYEEMKQKAEKFKKEKA